MGNSWSCHKSKGVDLLQGLSKRKGDVVQISSVIERPLIIAENAPSSFGQLRNVVLLLDFTMSFLSTIFLGLFLVYMTLTYQLPCHTIDLCLLSIALIR
jgi:hypothetical protein